MVVGGKGVKTTEIKNIGPFGEKYAPHKLSLSGFVCVLADVSRKKGCWSGSVTVYVGHSGMAWSILITPRLTPQSEIPTL